MENYQLSRFLPRNKILDYMSALDEYGLTTFVIQNADDYDIYLVTLLDEVAKEKNTPLWYKHLGILCSAHLFFIHGAQLSLSALFYFIKSHELDLNDTSILHSILDFGEQPEIVLTKDQNKYYAAKLLTLEPESESESALAIINS